MKKVDHDFILGNYTAEEMKVVHNDILNHISGVNYLYVIDTYDLVENFVPYTIKDLFKGEKRNQLAQRYICYDYLFSKFDNSIVILANEYIDELFGVKNKLFEKVNDAEVLLGNIHELKEQTTDIEVVLFLLILNSKSGNAFDSFLSFQRNRMIISNDELKNKTNQKVSELFKNTSDVSLAATIFERFVNDNMISFVSSKSKFERVLFLENTYRDIQVIVRVMQINRALKENQLDFYLVYLSSARKTSEILKSMNSINLNTKFDLGFHRNIFQYFLKRKIETNLADTPNEMKEITDELISIKKDIEKKLDPDSPEYKTNQFDKLNKLTKSIFDEGASTIDNYFYLDVFEQYKDAFENTSDKVLKLELYNKMLKEVQSNSVNVGSKLREFKLGLLQVQNSIAINELVNFTRRHAKDIIQNQYQSLPVLLFANEKEHKWIHSLYSFMNNLIELSKLMEEDDIDKLKASLVQHLDDLFTYFQAPKVTSEHLQKRMLTAYISFVANNEKMTDQSLISEIQGLILVNKAAHTEIDSNATSEDNFIRYKIGYNEFEIELNYILIWLLRRSKKEVESIELCNKLVPLNPREPRFFHGRALCYLVTGYDKLKNKEQSDAIAYFNLAKNDFSEAYKLYLLIRGELESREMLIDKIISAILNSLANIDLRLYMLSEDQNDISLLLQASKRIEDIKNLFIKMDLRFNEHVTYFGTEIEIKYLLARYFKNSGDTNSFKEEIREASKLLLVLKKLPDFKYSDGYFQQRFEKVPKLMFESFNKD
jgi:hypothetical protein